MTENVIIIGGGPAGLAAAIYNARAGLKPFLIAGSPPGGQLTLTTEVENYPGFESIMGPELIDKMRRHAVKFDVRIIDQNVTEVDFTKKPFVVKTIDKTFEGKSVIIATGAKALWLNIPSEQKLRGKGVSACATCDGFFFRDKTVAVVGGGDTAMEEALTLTKFAKKVYVIHRRGEFRASKIMQERVLNNPKIEVIWNSGINEVLGDMKVSGVELVDTVSSEKKKLDVDGLFIAIGHKPDTDIFKGKIELDKKGYILTAERASFENLSDKIEKKYRSATNINGVFASGDCVDHEYRQAATAVGMGVAAALDVERWLLSQ